MSEFEAGAEGPAPGQTKRDRQNARLAKWLGWEQTHFAERIPSYVIDPSLRIEVGGCGGSLGRYDQNRKLITIAPMHYRQETAKQIRQTILHELIHHYCALHGEPGEGHHHGGLFREIALLLRLKNYGDNTWRWSGTCPTCRRRWKVRERRHLPGYCWYCPDARLKVAGLQTLTSKRRAELTGRPAPSVASPIPEEVETWQAEELAGDRELS